jgi:hypothetical protein
MQTRFIALALGVAAAFSLSPATAHGDPDDESVAAAEQLFRLARDLTAAGDHAAACPKFEASLRLDPALGTLLNLAECYTRLDRLASAWARFTEAAALAEREGDTKRRRYAQRRAKELEPRLPRLIIEPPPGQVAGLEVTRNGTRVELAALGAAIFVDPGPQEVRATAPGHLPSTATAVAIEARVVTVQLEKLAEDPAAREVTPPDEKPANIVQGPPPADDPGRSRRWLGLGIGAAGAASTLVGLGFGLGARAAWNRAFDEGLCEEETRVCTGAGQALTDKARRRATFANALIGSGLVLVGAGAVLFFTAPAAPSRDDIAVSPYVGDGGGGIAVSGQF